MRLLRHLPAALVFVLAGACSLFVESSSSQCETDSDCYSRGGEFSASICMIGRCLPPEAGVPDGGLCTTNRECADKLLAPALCRGSDHKCTRILSPDCPIINGDANDDNAIFLGALNSVSGTNGPSGVARQNSGDLALNEIKQNVVGIRATANGPARPLVFVECDDSADDIAPATHLVEDLEVPAIIGVASSSRVIDLARKVTIPKGVLLITPAATSPSITDLQDNGLVWRTSPSDVIQAIALNDQLPAIEAKYRADNALATNAKVRLAIVYIDEAYGLGLYEPVTRDGKINGKPIGDPSNSGLTTAVSYKPDPTTLEPQVALLLAQDPRPNIIVGFGSTEMITKLLAPLESRWGTASPKPLYLFADAVQKTELLDLVAKDNALRKRVRGTVPAAPRSSTNLQSFVFKYEGAYGAPAPSVFGMAGTYDSVFLLGYTIAAAADRPLTGTELAKGFARVVTGDRVDTGGSNMNNGLSKLTDPGMFDFEGASGPLDFDLKTGEAPSNIDVWCIKKDGGSGTPGFVPSGRDYDPKLGAMTGTYSTTTCQGAATD